MRSRRNSDEKIRMNTGMQLNSSAVSPEETCISP